MNNPFGVDAVICLCLDKRKELWRNLEADALARNWNFKTFIVGDGTDDELVYDWVDPPIPDNLKWGAGNPSLQYRHYYAFKSHAKMLEYCKKNNYSSVLFMEDDAYITNRFNHIEQIIVNSKEYEDLDWHLLYLGWWIGGDRNKEPADINNQIEEQYKNGIVQIRKMRACGGLHGVIIKSTMFDWLLSFPAVNNIDCQLDNYHDLIKSYYVAPKIIHTQTAYSFTEGYVIEREIL